MVFYKHFFLSEISSKISCCVFFRNCVPIKLIILKCKQFYNKYFVNLKTFQDQGLLSLYLGCYNFVYIKT